MSCGRNFRLIMRDPALRTPEIETWLRQCQETMQPLIDRAIELMERDIRAYGTVQRSAEDYVKEVLLDAHADL